MSDWYYVENGERRGPVATDVLSGQISSGGLPSNTLVWRDGMSDWAPADTLHELSGGFVSTYPGPAGSPILESGQPGQELGGYDPFAQSEYGDVQPIAYAGFWKRFAAYIIDYLIVTAVNVVVQIGFTIFMGMLDASGADEAVLTGFVVVFLLLWTGAYFVFYAWFESSKFQGTPGKIVVQIKVTDLEGHPVSFGRALGRNVAKILSSVILLFGFLMVAFTERKQGLHDMIAGCLVVDK